MCLNFRNQVQQVPLPAVLGYTAGFQSTDENPSPHTCQRLIIASALEPLIVEVLHRLIVDETVRDAVAADCVGFIHLDSEFCPPLQARKRISDTSCDTAVAKVTMTDLLVSYRHVRACFEVYIRYPALSSCLAVGAWYEALLAGSRTAVTAKVNAVYAAMVPAVRAAKAGPQR